MERNHFIDFIKGISIFGVFIIHVALFLFTEETVSFFSLYADAIFRFAVPFFFGVLGYMTYTKYRSLTKWKDFYFNKFMYIVIPFLLWSALYTKMPIIFEVIEEKKMNLLLKIVLGYSEVHLYFMVPYITFILLTPLTVKLFNKLDEKVLSKLCTWIIAIFVGVLILVEKSTLAGENTIFEITGARLFIQWIGYFAIGVFIAINWDKIKILFGDLKKTKSVVFGGGIFAYIIVTMFYTLTGKIIIPYLTPFLVLMSLLAFWLLGVLYSKVNHLKAIKGVLILGRNTFPFYLAHVFFLKVGYNLFCADKLNELNMLYTALFGFALTLLYVEFHNKAVNVHKDSVKLIKQRFKMEES